MSALFVTAASGSRWPGVAVAGHWEAEGAGVARAK